MTDSFEIMKLWIPLKFSQQANKENSIVVMMSTPTNDERTEAEWEKASQLANVI